MRRTTMSRDAIPLLGDEIVTDIRRPSLVGPGADHIQQKLAGLGASLKDTLVAQTLHTTSVPLSFKEKRSAVT